MLSDRIRRAINTSALAHSGHKRKFGVVPYVSHPYGVAFILTNYTDNEDAIIAALFHDIIEDIDPKVYSKEDIRSDFGERVLELVLGVTEDKSLEDYRTRKQAYLDNLARSDQETLLVSAADFAHNMFSLADDIENIGIDAWRDSVDPESRVWFYRERCEFLKHNLHSDITQLVDQAYRRVANLIGS